MKVTILLFHTHQPLVQEKPLSRTFWLEFPFELSDINSALLRSPSREIVMKVLIFFSMALGRRYTQRYVRS